MRKSASSRRFAFFVFFLFLLPVIFASAWGQGPRSDADLGSYETNQTIAKPRRVEAVAGPVTLQQRFDAIFETIVAGFDRVLFYRVFSHERAYIQFVDQQDYYRSPDSQDPFQSTADAGQSTAGAGQSTAGAGQTLTARQINREKARGRLVTGDDGSVIRQGTFDGQAVEFVTVIGNDSRYILGEDGQFHRLLEREQLSDNDMLSFSEAEAEAEAGRLKVEVTKREDGLWRVRYVMEERVGGAPLVVLWLACGAVFFTVYMRGVNLWGFGHAVDVVRGRYDNPDEPGEVTHFQALASALSATVGLGNIAGVTIAMTTGGPGAFFWMMLCGFFGMTSKFVECTLGQKFRIVKPDGTVLGGPMQYLHVGLRGQYGRVMGGLGFVLSILFAVMCILASFGGGNMFQANQSGQQVMYMLRMNDVEQLQQLRVNLRVAAEEGDDEAIAEYQAQQQEIQQRFSRFGRWFPAVYGAVLAFMVAIVIIGGIKRIGAAAEKVVPTMCVIYLAACLFIIAKHLTDVPGLVTTIFSEAWQPRAFGGGLLGVLVVGVQRAAFSNEAGVGSAAIAHSAAKTEEPIREGAVALLGPFIDTVVVCSMTALVILITGAWNNEQWVVEQGLEGTPLTTKAFQQEISWFPYLLSVAVVLFAYSTLISWSYYGERCWERLFGLRSTILYKCIYVAAAFLGAIFNLGAVLDFSDMMILSMAFPNIFGLILLSPLVRTDLENYWRRYKAGEFKTFQ